MNRHLHRMALSTLVLTAATLVAAAGPVSAGAGGTLTVYSGRTPELIQPLLDAFSADTGTEIEVRYGDSADLALLIDAEGDQTPADVLISQSPGATGYLDGNGRLRTI